MLIVLSPAKSLDFETAPGTTLHSTPDHLDQAARLIGKLRRFSPSQLADLMGLSDKLAALNVARYESWTPEPLEARQAVMAFNGDVYAGLDARSLQPGQLDYAQAHLRILSGLYGVLRPLDLIQPHRLEMGTRLANRRGADLYAFWGERITDGLNRAAREQGARVLLNLASEEYFKSVKPARLDIPVIAPVFEEWKGGKYKIISFYAKRARGLMARYAAVNAIRDPEQLKQFSVDGYAFEPGASDQRRWLFRRRLAD